MNLLELSFVRSEMKIVLESLIEKEQSMAAICEHSDDEDEVADIGNDLIEVRLLIERLVAEAVPKFGDSVLVFDRTPL